MYSIGGLYLYTGRVAVVAVVTVATVSIHLQRVGSVLVQIDTLAGTASDLLQQHDTRLVSFGTHALLVLLQHRATLRQDLLEGRNLCLDTRGQGLLLRETSSRGLVVLLDTLVVVNKVLWAVLCDLERSVLAVMMVVVCGVYGGVNTHVLDQQLV